MWGRGPGQLDFNSLGINLGKSTTVTAIAYSQPVNSKDHRKSRG